MQGARALGPTETEQRKALAQQRHQNFLAAVANKGRAPALYTVEWQARIGLTETQFSLLAGELAYLLGLGPARDASDGTAPPAAPSWKLQRTSAFQSVDSLLLFWLRCLQASAVVKPARKPTQLEVAQECHLKLTQPQANKWATRMNLWGERLLKLFLTGGSAQEFKAAMKVAHFSPKLAHLTKYQEDCRMDRNAAEDHLYRSGQLPPVPDWVLRQCEKTLATLA